MDELNKSLGEYEQQLSLVNSAIIEAKDDTERESLLTLQTDLNQLIELTKESLDAVSSKVNKPEKLIEKASIPCAERTELDDEYALFQHEMAKSGAFEDQGECSQSNNQEDNDAESDIQDELGKLLGMKCAVYHIHKWGGQPTLHNAMVSAVGATQGDDKFNDLQVQVLFTHPTHAEMLPCPFYLDGECRFDDDSCRYSHGAVVQLSSLKEAIDPNFDLIKVGSIVLLKLKPPDGEDISLKRKSTEKYHLWHRAIVKSFDPEKRMCTAKLEHGLKTGEKRKSVSDEFYVHYEDVFPLNTEEGDSDSDGDSISDTEYPDNKTFRTDGQDTEKQALLVERSFQHNGPAMGDWERHTRGIGSKIMLAMGYVPGTGLGAEGDGRVQPVEAQVLPVGKSLDHCMAISKIAAGEDPLKVGQRILRLQKREEERNKRAYEREKEKERRNVFNFINKTLGDKAEEEISAGPSVNIKQSTSKDLNIEQFKITEDSRRLEREITKLNSSLVKYPEGSPGHRTLNIQITEKSKELALLKCRENQISAEQKNRKDKLKMAVF